MLMSSAWRCFESFPGGTAQLNFFLWNDDSGKDSRSFGDLSFFYILGRDSRRGISPLFLLIVDVRRGVRRGICTWILFRLYRVGIRGANWEMSLERWATEKVITVLKCVKRNWARAKFGYSINFASGCLGYFDFSYDASC